MSASRLVRSALKIPKHIERGSTDILKALASTVKHIPIEPELSLQDDPFLLPVRPSDRRVFILSKLSGAKTAKFFLNKYPKLFYRDDAEPKIEAFSPMEEFKPEMEFTEDDIKWCIENKDAVNGVVAYNSLKKKNLELSNETLIQFFEMICYTNEESLVDYIDYERSRFSAESNEQHVNFTWKTSGLASKIFNQIKEDLDPPRVYSAMIAGLSRFNEHETSRQVFNDFRENHPNKGLYTSAYDGLLRSVPRIYSSVTSAYQAMDEVVNHMEDNLIAPELEVFNSILICYRNFICDEGTCQNVFKILNDMKALNIEPSLSTLSSAIVILSKYKSGRIYREIIHDILAYVENSGETIPIRDDRDAQFFSNAMNSIVNRLNDLKLANKLHKIYLKQPNIFANQRYRSRYLNNYFKLIITTDSLEDILKFYETYVPMNFQPTPDCYEALAEALDLYQAPGDVIKKIGQDLIQFNIASKIKNDGIFRKDQSYVDALEKS